MPIRNLGTVTLKEFTPSKYAELMSEFSKFVTYKGLILICILIYTYVLKNEDGLFMSFIEIYGSKRKPERLLWWQRWVSIFLRDEPAPVYLTIPDLT